MRQQTIHPCPDPVELSRAFPKGGDARLHAHLEQCARCGTDWRGFDRLRLAGKDLPTSKLSGPTADRVRAALLATAPTSVVRSGSGRRHAWLLAPVALAAAAAVVLVVKRDASKQQERAPAATASAGERRGDVKPHGAAVFVQDQVQPDEIVRLKRGTVAVDVRPLRPGERFRLVIGDDEIEVHGTAFEATATDDHLTAVRVLHGLVEVRPAARPAVFLKAGERWVAETPPESIVDTPPALHAPAPPPRTAPTRPIASPFPPLAVPPVALPAEMHIASLGPAPTNAPQSETERQFQIGWAALRAKDPAAAAQAFGAAADAGSGAPLAEDARFWRAVALSRAGQRADTRSALATFIDRYPGSPRLGEASAMLGWLLLKDGDAARAEKLFRVAERDRVDEVHRNGLAGLTAVAATRGESR